MTTTKLEIAGLDCLCCKADGATSVVYLLYPMDILDRWVEKAAGDHGVTIAVITGMDWDNVFSPWPAPGQPPGSPDFKGEAPEFLKLLTGTVVPGIESRIGIPAGVVRTLVGVSMSGLFTLWQWMLSDFFTNIASLSGSFWYEGFLKWFESQPVPPRRGRGYFLLGDQEAKSPVRAFQSVASATAAIVSRLKGAGIDVEFQSVHGNHFADPIGRLDSALASLFPPQSR